MNDELSALVRAAAHDETAAAEREFPYTAATLGRFVRDVRRRRAAGGAMLAVAGVALIGGAAYGVDSLMQAAPPPAIPVGDPTPSVTATPVPDRTPTATATPTLDPTPTPTPTPTPSETPPPPTPEETTPPPPVEPVPDPPGALSGLVAHPGGGSGEIIVVWETTPGATGYRVYRADAAEGPYRPAASIDLTTGVVTVEYSGAYEYIGIVQGIQWPTSVEYDEAVGSFGYFRVLAFNSGGEGPLSGVVCAEPQNGLSPEVSEC